MSDHGWTGLAFGAGVGADAALPSRRASGVGAGPGAHPLAESTEPIHHSVAGTRPAACSARRLGSSWRPDTTTTCTAPRAAAARDTSRRSLRPTGSQASALSTAKSSTRHVRPAGSYPRRRRHKPPDHETPHTLPVTGHEEDVLRLVDQPVQVARVLRQGVLRLAPEPRLLQLVVLSTASSQGSHVVDVIVSCRPGGMHIHGAILPARMSPQPVRLARNGAVQAVDDARGRSPWWPGPAFRTAGERLVIARLGLAIPLAIRSLSRSWPRRDRSDDGPNATCGDAPDHHQSDGRGLTSDP